MEGIHFAIRAYILAETWYTRSIFIKHYLQGAELLKTIVQYHCRLVDSKKNKIFRPLDP